MPLNNVTCRYIPLHLLLRQALGADLERLQMDRVLRLALVISCAKVYGMWARSFKGSVEEAKEC